MTSEIQYRYGGGGRGRGKKLEEEGVKQRGRGGEIARRGTRKRSERGEMGTGTGVLLSDDLSKTVIRQRREKRYRHPRTGGRG